MIAAFTVADEVHEVCSRSDNWDEYITDCAAKDDVVEENDLQDGENDHQDRDEGSNLDPYALEEAIKSLYAGARSTKLAATVLLMNLCTVHGVSNCFVDELFTILQGHLLPEENCLPKNYYVVKTLTRNLGLSYNTIHACESGCVLFRGVHADKERCPKCSKPRFKDEWRKKFPVKVLRHFPLIPRLQRLFRSPTISKLMHWHWENRSSCEGGTIWLGIRAIRRHGSISMITLILRSKRTPVMFTSPWLQMA
jgi:hypothetical protein